jgi:hypothetical protein
MEQFELHLDNEFASISHSRKLKTIKLVWKKHVSKQAYRETFTQALQHAIKYKLENFLSDTRLQGAIQLEDLQWLYTDVLKVAVQSGLRKIAVVKTDSLTNTLYLNAIRSKLQDTTVKMHYFESEADALNWLLDKE